MQLYIIFVHFVGRCVTITKYQCQPPEHEDCLSAGAIAGIVIGILVFLFVAFVIILIIYIKVKIVPALKSLLVVVVICACMQ